MPPEDDDEVTIKGLFEDAISPELKETAREARDAARALTETGAGGEAAAVGMDRATIAAGRLKHELEAVDRAQEQQRLSQLRLTSAEQEAQRIRQKGVLTAAEMARVEGMLSHAHSDATKASKDLEVATGTLIRAQDNLAVRLLRTAGSVGFLTKAFSGLKLIATTDVFTSLVGGVSSLGAAGVAAVAGLAPLLGTVGGIPALGLAAVSTFGAVSMLTGGIMKAVKAMETSGPASAGAVQAINMLGPEAQGMAYRVYDLTYSLKQYREEALRSAAPAIYGTLNNVQKLLPVVRTGFVGVSQAVAQTVDDATTRMVGARSDLELIAQRNTVLVRTIGHAIVDGLDAGRHIMIGAGPMVQNFANRFSDEMRRVDNELAANPQKVQAYFDRAYNRTMDFLHVLSDLGHGIVNVFRGAQPLTDHMGTSVMTMASEFRQWTESAQGQNSIRTFFTDAIPVVEEVGHLVGNIGRALGDLSTNSGTAGMLKTLADIIPPLTKLLTLTEKVANEVPGANTVLGILFLANRVGLGPGVLGRGTAGLLRGGTLFSRGMRGIEGVEGGFAGRTSQSMMGRLGARMSGRALGGIAEMGGADAGALAVGTEAGGAGLMGLLAAVPVVGWIAAAVIAIGTGAVLLYQHWKPFRDLVDATGRGIEHAAEWVAGKFMSAVRGVRHAWDDVTGAFKEAYHWIEGIADKAEHLFDKIPGHGLISGAAHLLGLYTGGPVAANTPYLVGERGAELFVTAGTMRVIGGDGAELLASRTPGFVLPNEALKAIQNVDVRAAAARAFPNAMEPVPVGAGARGGADFAVNLQGLPPIIIGPHNTFTTEMDVEAAVARGIQAWVNEQRDRS